MSTTEIPKAYLPTDVEPTWYKRWCETGCFAANPDSPAPPFSIVIPPPNVTGVLTLGHVLNNTLQDILARRARQTGHEVLWLPGTDHAGIATQTVVERQLRKEEKKTRHDLGRIEFLKRIWTWKEKHGGIIIEQLRRLGCSCDWSRERFTMDPTYVTKVQETFIDLYNKGLIYRGKRMVNWCPVSLTALSDEEVIPKKQKGILYHFKLEVIEEPGTWLEIATTRPETIMGDSAIAVNPTDRRYAHLIGKHVRRPLPMESNIELPIIGDEAVDKEYGTGILKVTPAHDQIDYAIGVRHQLPIIDVLNPNGTLNELAGADFAGLDRFEARLKAAERLRELGLLTKEEFHENNVGFSERADVPIEPRLSEQWFLRYPKTAQARSAVRDRLIRFFPERWEKVYDHWLENIQDWCISRQLWWGHQIPVWYPASGDFSQIKVQIESPGEDWKQDPDVLDTWFSSWLWAHETMDEVTQKKFYPTSVLVTGPDIIFFWVARMIMAGLEYTGKIPFRDVYFTGIIRDKTGRKMSKSLGNSPDPLELIGKYGADGLRFGIMRIAPSGQDIRFDEKQIEEGRNFANKLWNAARFREMHGRTSPDLSQYELPEIAITILAQFDAMHASLRAAYEEYRFQEIASLLYHFFWGDYCDWFVEAAKPAINGTDEKTKMALLATMDVVLSGFLRLLHPLMPHITEELWARLGFKAASANKGRPELVIYLQPPAENSLQHVNSEKITHARATTEKLYEVVGKVRNLRSEMRINAKQAVDFLVTPKNQPWSDEQITIFSALTRAKKVTFLTENPPPGSPSIITDLGTITMPMDELIDVDAEKKRLCNEIAKVEIELLKVKSKLDNADFVQKVPAAVLAEHRDRQAKWHERLTALHTILQSFEPSNNRE
ncbi:MAG: valine--tRNA ligase [Chthoniobacterales bacterium]